MRVTCTCGTNQPMGPDGSCVMCTCGTFSISIRPVGTDSLRVTCCRRGLIKSNSKKTMRPRSQTRYPDQGIDRLHHCARRLVVLICLWSPNSSICSLCGYVNLYIRCIPYKWKQICAHWTCDGGYNGGSQCVVVAQASFWW